MNDTEANNKRMAKAPFFCCLGLGFRVWGLGFRV